MAAQQDALNSLVDSAVALLQQLETVLLGVASTSEPSQPTSDASTSSIDALSLAHDSAALIKAHSTKISLFIISEPFTPSAIAKVLRELVAGPVPALASAVQACDPRRYTDTLRRDLAWRCYTVLRELRALVERVPRDGRILSGEQKHGSGTGAGKGSIAATGTLWSACDAVVRFRAVGIAGHFVKKVEDLRDTLKDIMEELKEWGEDTGDGGDDDDGNGGGSVATEDEQEGPHASTQALLDSLMSSHQTIPADDPDRIRERLDSCLKRLRLTTLLYQAILKRRIKKLPQLPTDEPSAIPQRLDEVAKVLRQIPDRFGDLAAAFYDLRPDEIDRVMDQCFFDAFAASELLLKSWDGERDEFTDWAEKFQVEIKKS